jgi:hypothetical protein
VKRKIPYGAWSRECTRFSNSQSTKPIRVVEPVQKVSEKDNEFKGGGEMIDAIRGRKHSFNVILPKRIGTHTDAELKLMLVTLKNAIVAISVYISKIENELQERGVDTRILSSPRPATLNEIDEAMAM